MSTACNYVWVDPPSGWKYGFPKLWNGVGNMRDFILRNNYPQAMIDRLGESFYVGVREASEDDILKFAEIDNP